jgi:acyl-coenzyme A thioesterase PaaI-like protein
MTSGIAFQDDVFCKGNHCWVCGNENPYGLKIKSYWDGNESICTWKPEGFHTAGWPPVLNGGIISGIIDCHCMCTMIAEYYKNKNLEEKEFPEYWFATASMKIDFLKPTPVDKPVLLRANIKEMHEKKAVVSCSLYSDVTECASGEVLGVRVPALAGPGK